MSSSGKTHVSFFRSKIILRVTPFRSVWIYAKIYFRKNNCVISAAKCATAVQYGVLQARKKKETEYDFRYGITTGQ